MIIAGRIILVVTVALLGLFSISLLRAASVRPAHFEQVARAAVQTGILARTVALPLAPRETYYSYNFNDCLILSMLLLPSSETAVRRAISPSIPISDGIIRGEVPGNYPQFVQCQFLAYSLEGRNVPSQYYHRYVHGDWVLAGVLLSALSLQTATDLLLTALWGLLAAVALAAAHAVFAGPPAGRARAFACLAIAGTVAFSYAIPVFGRSLSFAPSDIILIGFVLFACRFPLSEPPELQFATITAVFGALTAIFEFFIGAIPAGVIILLGMLALDPSADERVLYRRAVLGLVCYASAILLCFAAKALAVTAIWGWSEISDAAARLGSYAGKASWDVAPDNAARVRALGIDPETVRGSRLLSTLFAFAKLAYFSSFVGCGSRIVGIAILAAPLLWAAAGIVRRPRDWRRQPRDVLVLLAALVMPAWYVLFVTHTIIHANIMARPMTWPFAFVVARLTWRWVARRPQMSCRSFGERTD